MTNGHEKLANKIKSEAASRKADAKLYLSHSTNPKKDPLPFDAKVKYATKAFGPMVQNSAARTIIEVAKELSGKYSNFVVVVGSDRVPEFKTLLNKYNGKDFTFDSIEIVSAGERDPDAEGVEGMSGSKMRRFAEDEDFASFRKGVPSKLSDDDAKGLFDAVRKGMKLDEEVQLEEGEQTTADYKVSKSGKKYPAHKIVLGKEKEEKNEEVEHVDEAVLSLSQRRERAMQLRRMQTRIQRARMIAMRRFANKATLMRRARKSARTALKRRFASGVNYDTMATGQKIAVDKRLEKMKPVIGKIAVRMMPTVRRREIERKQSAARPKMESFDQVQEANARLDQLIRYGLADKSMMSNIKRAMDKLTSGDQLNPSERKATEALVNTLVDMVTSSDALFRLTKSQLQKEEVIIRKSYIKEEDDYEDVEMDGIHMAKVELSAIIEDADEVLSMLEMMEEEPDAWVLSKITMATDYITTIRDYLEYYSEEDEEEDDEEPEMEAEEVIRQMPVEELGEAAELFEYVHGLQKKSEKTGIPYATLREVYERGLQSYEESPKRMTQDQWAFARVNSFISGGATDSDLRESVDKNNAFKTFAEGVLEYGTDTARMTYARMTPGQSQEIINARYSAEAALEVINNANMQRAMKLYSEEACCDECQDEIVEEVDWDLVLHEAEYQGKDVSLNKPFYTPDGPKKSAVYTMGPNGKVVIVRFGDPNMEIKKDNPERRASFRARHNCDDPGPKWKARYWSCKAW